MLSGESGDKIMKAVNKKENITYIVECADHTLYTGWTKDLKKRIEKHNSGEGAKYTRSRRPVRLVYYEVHETREEAMRREYVIKKMTRAEKQALIMEKGPAALPGERDQEHKTD